MKNFGNLKYIFIGGVFSIILIVSALFVFGEKSEEKKENNAKSSEENKIIKDKKEEDEVEKLEEVSETFFEREKIKEEEKGNENTNENLSKNGTKKDSKSENQLVVSLNDAMSIVGKKFFFYNGEIESGEAAKISGAKDEKYLLFMNMESGRFYLISYENFKKWSEEKKIPSKLEVATVIYEANIKTVGDLMRSSDGIEYYEILNLESMK